MLRLAANLPDPLVGLAPVRDGQLDLLDEDRPDPLWKLVACLRVQVEGVEERAPDVVLVLLERAVPDPDRARPLIPAEMLDRIFDLFTQVNRSFASPSQWGLGIGLTLVRSLVEMHGGSVRAFSAAYGSACLG